MKLLFGFLLATTLSYGNVATYKVTIKSNWNRADHISVPGPAHFSPVVAVTHNQNYSLLPIGGMSTPGLTSVAETGRTNTIEKEIKKEMPSGKKGGAVKEFIITQNQFVKDQPIQTFTIKISKTHPYLSFASMIAPSPDWLIGLSSIKLYNEGVGYAEGVIERSLYAIDNGTENGDFGGNFGLNNSKTSPKQSISSLTGEGFLAPFAFVIIERL